MFLKFVSAALLVFLPTSVLAEGPVRLIQANKRVIFDEDMQCMNNETALKLSNKIKLCEKECEVRLDALADLRLVDSEKYEAKLLNQEEMFLSIVKEKDKTINILQDEILTNLSSNDFSWWEITLVVVGGVVVGSVTTAIVLDHAK